MPREERVLFDGDIAMQVAVRSAGRAGLTFAGDSDCLTLVDTGRDAHLDDAFFQLPAGAAARGAMFFNHAAFPTAVRAGGDHAEHAAKALLGNPALPAALWADDGAGARLGAGPFAIFAYILP